jgi:hypothetical protein
LDGAVDPKPSQPPLDSGRSTEEKPTVSQLITQSRALPMKNAQDEMSKRSRLLGWQRKAVDRDRGFRLVCLARREELH